MVISLLVILALVLILPFVLKIVEKNLEIFLFIMGLASVVVSGSISVNLFLEILSNYFVYFITLAVLVFGVLFIIFKKKFTAIICKILQHIPSGVFAMILIIILGLLSSIITAIIAALLLVEILACAPINKQQKVNLTIITCFSIGLGAVLTPIGEPLATVVISKLNEDFLYLARLLGIFILPGIVAMGVIGLVYINFKRTRIPDVNINKDKDTHEEIVDFELSEEFEEPDTIKGAVVRAIKIFFFVFALELLGTGFKPLIDTYVINMSNNILYWLNMISAILDNATLAAAEISNKMTAEQISAILMGLLISGGMLIPGNIPNIISASKMKIKSREWARLGVPLGLAIMFVYFIIIFLI